MLRFMLVKMHKCTLIHKPYGKRRVTQYPTQRNLKVKRSDVAMIRKLVLWTLDSTERPVSLWDRPRPDRGYPQTAHTLASSQACRRIADAMSVSCTRPTSFGFFGSGDRQETGSGTRARTVPYFGPLSCGARVRTRAGANAYCAARDGLFISGGAEHARSVRGLLPMDGRRCVAWTPSGAFVGRSPSSTLVGLSESEACDEASFPCRKARGCNAPDCNAGANIAL